MSATPVVSFVVPSYNYGRYLRACIDSILCQEGGYDLEVIVIDDASGDDSCQILQSYTDPRIRVYYHKKNKGHVDTINEGFELARGRFIARIDSDDRYRPYFLQETLSAFERIPKVAVVHANAAWIDAEGRVLEEFPYHPRGSREFTGSELLPLLKTNFLPAPTAIARREAWDDALPIPAGMGFSDWYLSLRMARERVFHYVPRSLAEYRIHGEGLHLKMILDRTEEPTVLRVLDDIFERGSFSAKFKRSIYANQYKMLADKYFGARMMSDARRCYMKTVGLRPSAAFEAGILRRSLATLIGYKNYEALKSLILGSGKKGDGVYSV